MLKLFQKISQFITKPFLGAELPNGKKLYRISRSPTTWILTPIVFGVLPTAVTLTLFTLIESRSSLTFILVFLALISPTLGFVILLMIRTWREEAALSQPISADHGDSLLTVIKNLREEKYEHTVLFNLSGQKVLEQTILCRSITDMDRAEFDRLFPHYNNLIDLHNHPEEDYPFSCQDFLHTLACRPRIAIVVSPNRLYFLIPTDATPVYTDEDYPTLEDELKTATKSLLHAYGFQWSQKQKYATARAICQELADQYHLVYLSIPLNPPV